MNFKCLAVAAMSVTLFCNSSYAQQERSEYQCHHIKSRLANAGSAAKPTVASPEEDKYDVKYVKLNVEMTNVATTLGGDVTTVAQVVAPTLSNYVFELEPPLIIDSVLIDGMLSTASIAGDIVTVSLPAPLAAGTMFTAQVFYHGTPVSGTSFNIKGINTLSSPSWGNWATFTLSESYRAREWWPCKQSLRDKIDSADIWITVADSLKAGSNGILRAITPMGGARNRYEWAERYPIDYYLISAAVAKYVDYSFYMHFTGSADSMLVQNYIYDNPATLPNFKSVIDSTAEQVDYFSSIYGRYPFWKEKYGHAMAPLSGGMEHQTMTTLGFFQSWLVAHELGHQWFGDNVTCATWADIFINEGFASYTEYLYADHFRGHAAATADIVDRQDNVMSELDGALYVDDTTDEGRIFSSRLSYDKGACMIHTLRHVINNDNNFFDLLRAWQTSMKDSTGSGDDFSALTQTLMGGTINGINIDTFFKQWFYGEGYPAYTATWNKIGDDVYVMLKQATTAPSSVSLFKVPLELNLRAATGDTVIRIVNNEAEQMLHFTWSKAMTGLAIDPNHWLIDSVTKVSKDVSLGVTDLISSEVTIYPNPSLDSWTATGLPANCAITLTDITGKVLISVSNGSSTNVTIPGRPYSAGIYLLRINTESGMGKTYKLIKS